MTRFWMICVLVGGVAAARMCGGVPVTYSLTESGRVSVAVYNLQGQQVRTLLSGAAQIKGKHRLEWDGLDWTGRPAPAGDYTWRLLQSPGLKSEFLMRLGTSFNYQDWPCNHGGPSGVAVLGDTAILAGAGECTPSLAMVDMTSGKFLRAEHFLVGDIAAANGRLFSLGVNNDKDAGRLSIRQFDNGSNVLASVELTQGVTTTRPFCVSACAKQLAIAYSPSGEIEWRSQDDPQKVLGKAVVSNLSDMALTPAGTVLALCGNTVVEVGPATINPVVRISGLSKPNRIAVDESNGDILVVDNNGFGQIRRYSKDFVFVRAYGRAGGRQQGLYNPEDFCAVSDIAADGHGGFVIVENMSAPRRLSHFDVNGKLLNEWYGGQLFFTMASSDPADPRHVWMNSHWGWVMETEVDYEKRTWKPRAAYTVQGLVEGLFDCSSLGLCGVMRRHEDQRYIVNEDEPKILRVDEANRRLIPLVAFGYEDSISPTLNSIMKEVNQSRAPNGKYHSYLWQDANDDGVPQKEEVSFSTYGRWRLRWTLDEHFNYYFSERTSGKTWTNIIHRLPVKRWDGARPVYPAFEEAELVAQLPITPEMAKARTDWEGPLDFGSDDAVYQIVKGRGEGFTSDYLQMGHTWLWPTGLSGDAGLCRWSLRDGGLQWRVGKLSATARQFIPGQLDDPIRFLGRLNGLVLLANRVVMPMEAWTDDGLFAGSLFDRHAEDGLPPATYTWWMGKALDGREINSPFQYDMYVGGSIRELPDGDILYFGAGWNHVPVYRVSGWKDFKRQAGRLRVKKQAKGTDAAGTGLLAEYFANDALAGIPVLKRTDPLLWFGNADTLVKKGWPDTNLCNRTFSARWTGFLEPRFSEAYTLKAYVGGGRRGDDPSSPKAVSPPEPVRVWLGKRLVIDGWQRPLTNSCQIESAPIQLEAGRKVPIRVEYVRTNTGYLHLCWESASQEIEHVPPECLYPDNYRPKK